MPFPDLTPLAWLIPLAHYDLRKREVPHIAFVAVPLALAALAEAWRGGWTLALMAVTLVAMTERARLWPALHRPALAGGLAICAGLLALQCNVSPFELAPGAISLIGFWLAYELGWWAGADALAAMALALLWPDDIRLLVSLAAAHIVAALAAHFCNRRKRPLRHSPLRGSQGRLLLLLPRKLSAAELQAVGAPGLPAIALTAALFAIWKAST